MEQRATKSSKPHVASFLRFELSVPLTEGVDPPHHFAPLLLVIADLEHERNCTIRATIAAVRHVEHREGRTMAEIDLHPRLVFFDGMKEDVRASGRAVVVFGSAGLEAAARSPRLPCR